MIELPLRRTLQLQIFFAARVLLKFQVTFSPFAFFLNLYIEKAPIEHRMPLPVFYTIGKKRSHGYSIF